ncbi:MAG TPA: preprotein translocase subunit SecG [Patescibacteria group bacterium]|nr:preprotein translocase subunit SecG [Patescibacteria group bacterium]
MQKEYLLVVQIVFGLFLITLVLLQGKGAGLGSTFGGNLWTTYSTKRGVEKVVFNLTIASATFFFLSSLALLLSG